MSLPTTVASCLLSCADRETRFESCYSTRRRIVKRPVCVEEAHQILVRARDMAANGGTWGFGVLTNDCEHFVNKWWNPGEHPHGRQAGAAAAQIGAAAGVAGHGALGTWPALQATLTNCAFDLVPTFAVLPTNIVVAVSAASILGGVGLVGGLAYGVRESPLADKAKNAKLIPIAHSFFNRSCQTNKANLGKDRSEAWYVGLHAVWHEYTGVGVMSCNIDSG